MMKINFWGVRGSYPQSGALFNKVGGHTSCVSVTVGQQLIIFDAGTGLIELGNWMMKEKPDFQSIHFLLSHFHLDHVFGIPFFIPLWLSQTTLNFHSGTVQDFGGVYEALKKLFSPPYFPVPWDRVPSKHTYTDFTVGEQIQVGECPIQTIALDHPGGGSGYRINHEGKSVVYLSDTAHTPDFFERYVAFTHNADLLVYDATFTCAEFAKHPDWGHSTWKKATELAKKSGVKDLLLFHHAPEHTDNMMAEIEREARLEFPRTAVAYEGMVHVL